MDIVIRQTFSTGGTLAHAARAAASSSLRAPISHSCFAAIRRFSTKDTTGSIQSIGTNLVTPRGTRPIDGYTRAAHISTTPQLARPAFTSRFMSTMSEPIPSHSRYLLHNSHVSVNLNPDIPGVLAKISVAKGRTISVEGDTVTITEKADEPTEESKDTGAKDAKQEPESKSSTQADNTAEASQEEYALTSFAKHHYWRGALSACSLAWTIVLLYVNFDIHYATLHLEETYGLRQELARMSEALESKKS